MITPSIETTFARLALDFLETEDREVAVEEEEAEEVFL